MLSLTIDQLDAIVEYLANQLATLERIQSVSTIPRGAKQETIQERKET